MQLEYLRRSFEAGVSKQRSSENSLDKTTSTSGAAEATALLDAVLGGRRVLEDFRPLSDSLEWVVGQLYWDIRGDRAFLVDEVPFKITNDGNLSRKSAAMFFASVTAADECGDLEERIYALELGFGTALFARLFLDEFQSLCRAAGTDYYERLLYLLADRSPQMREDLLQRGTLSGHAGHYEICPGNASEPRLGLADGHSALTGKKSGVRVMFFNYVLDGLAAKILRVSETGVLELYVETALARGVNLSEHTQMSLDEVLRRARSDDSADKAPLAELYGQYSLRYEYRSVAVGDLPYRDLLSDGTTVDERPFLHSHGAIACLEESLSLLRPDGFILINDYDGAGPADQMYRNQHYGGSAALGLNFSQLKAHFENRGDCRWVEPPGNNRHLSSRLLGWLPAAAAEQRFRECFSLAAYDWHFVPIERARDLVKEGRWESALVMFRTALDRQPGNWALLTEVAKFLTYTLADYDGALRLTDRAMQLNPLSPELWNTRGDCFFSLKRSDEAHAAFMRALELNSHDVRARYNLSFTLGERADPLGALRVIADALFFDKTGRFRERLLRRQSALLEHMARVEEEGRRCWRDRFVMSESPRS